MKLTQTSALALAAGALAAPSTRQATGGCDADVTLDASTNVFQKYKLHANSFYRGEIEAAIETMTDSDLAAKAAKVADVGSFLWL